MARKQPRREPREQIDPFNAPDPIMPGDDDVAMESPASAALQTPEAPERRSGGDRPAATPKRRAPRRRAPEMREEDDLSLPWARRASRIALRVVTGFFALIVLLTLINVIGSLASSFVDWTSQEDEYLVDYDYYDDDDYYYDDDASLAESAMEAEASARVEEELLAYVAADEASVELAGESLAQAIEDWTGVRAADLGIDVAALTRWTLDNSSYEMSDAYAFAERTSDGFSIEGDVFFYVTMPDLDIVLNGLSALSGNELSDAVARGELTSGERALLAERLERLEEEALAEPRERFLYAEYRGSVAENGQVESLTFVSDPLEDLPL